MFNARLLYRTALYHHEAPYGVFRGHHPIYRATKAAVSSCCLIRAAPCHVCFTVTRHQTLSPHEAYEL